MAVDSLAELLEERRYGECREAAQQLLRSAELSDAGRAQAFLALSYSLSALRAGAEAIGPAELAVYFSRQSGDYDLAGRSLCHLAVLYHESSLHGRAVACLDTYFSHFALYRRAKALEGWVLTHMALCFQAMGQGPKALEYFKKAYRWQIDNQAAPEQIDHVRGELTWQHLRMGQVEPARTLLQETDVYLRQAPNDLEARAGYLTSMAYRHYLSGAYGTAIDTAVQVLYIRGVGALRKAKAFLTLHYTARALGLVKEATGLGTLARIQADMAGRPDLEAEATRSILHMQQHGGLPLMDELLRSLKQAGTQPAANH